MQFQFHRIDKESSRYNIVKDTCLIALKRKDRSPCILYLEIFIDLLLKVFVRLLQNDSLNAQVYNYINATIISTGIDWRERGYDFENFGARITWFGVTVEKIWRKEVMGAKIWIWEGLRAYLKDSRGSSGKDL
jgi:hypothetical protein